MNEQLEKILATYNTFWEKQSKNSKLAYIGSLIGIVVVAIIITIMLNKTDYALLYQNLESNEASQIISVIQEMGVDVKVEKNGTILVPKKQVDTLKLQLASQGFPKSALNYNTFKDNVDFMTTEYEKRLYRVYELQDRMAGTIQAIQGVKKAYVNITIPEDKDVVLVQNKEAAKASVQLELTAGVQLTPQQVTSIKELVAGGVPGLEAGKVSVSDTQGNQLSSGNDSLTDSGQSSAMIDFQKQLEQRYEEKVMNQFGPVFGNNKIRVTSTVIVDYGDKKTQDTNYYLEDGKDTGIPQHVENSEVKDTTGAAVGGVAGIEDNADIPVYPNGEGQVGGEYSEKSGATDYLVSNIITQMEKKGFEMKEVSISVMIDEENLDETLKKNLIEQVTTITGINSKNISLINVPFAANGNQIPPTANQLIPGVSNTVLFISIGALLLLLLVFIVVLVILKQRKKKKLAKKLEEDLNGLYKISLDGEDEIKSIKQNTAVNPLGVVETKETAIKREIKDFTNNHPEIAAQLLATWLKGEDDE